MKVKYIGESSNGLILIPIIILIIVGVICHSFGYKHGKEKGYIMALDTIDKILTEHLVKNKKITKLTISDTSTYYISKKTLK